MREENRRGRKKNKKDLQKQIKNNHKNNNRNIHINNCLKYKWEKYPNQETDWLNG